MSSGDSSVNLLKEPDQILLFIKHALETSQKQGDEPATKRSRPRDGLALEDLRIVEGGEEEQMDGGDSDDEDDGDNTAANGEDMTSTAVNLLLSVLEGE